MKERPILFSGPLVRAILMGKKTQTRRVVKLSQFGPSETYGYDWEFRDRRGLWNAYTTEQLLTWSKPRRRCPFHVGERLWVREAFFAERQEQAGTGAVRWVYTEDGRPKIGAIYRADGDTECERWKPGIHMPRCLSRITLEVTGVRVQHLHDITEDDARAEGIDSVDGELDDALICKIGKETGWGMEDYRSSFGALWCQINGADSWAANPWVWAVTFARVS